MQIEEVVFHNYRGINELKLQFDPRLTVLAGSNGGGKSTVLQGITLLLSWVVGRLRSSSGAGRQISEQEIANQESFAQLKILTSNAQVAERTMSVAWSITKARTGYPRPLEGSFYTDLNRYIHALQNEIATQHEQVNLPIFVHYPVHRAVLDIPLRIRERHSFSLLSAYDDALTSGANFRTFFEWFREREDLENENLRTTNTFFADQAGPYPDPQLEAVRWAIRSFLPEFDNLTVRRSPLRMEITKHNQRLIVNQLSDGEKCLIALIGDLARRLAIANPLRSNPLEGQGIVLIDEIDLHLHPSWQRLVISRLNEVFTGCQFIITTHSPHVLTHVEPHHLYLLELTNSGIVANRAQESYGKSVERILEDLMGLTTTRPDVVQAALTEIYQAISIQELDQARDQIAQLRQRIGNDPELVKADVLIKRKELIGR